MWFIKLRKDTYLKSDKKSNEKGRCVCMKKINVFNSQILYSGNSSSEFNRIRNILDLNKIPYKYELINHENKLLFGRGTTRSFGANFGKTQCIYEITICITDYEDAQVLITK